jgi:hypothetical protein
MRLRWKSALAGLLVFSLASCASWRTVGEHEKWILCAEPGTKVDAEAYARAFDPAVVAVESAFGPFRERVCVHAVAEDSAASSKGKSALGQPENLSTQVVPGIGLARVRAWHVRSTGPFGAPSGIYVGAPDAGTAAHELVHARLAELQNDLPLWLEEGLASIFGDGLLFGGRWVVDGLACWPLRELADQRIPDEELARLCSLRAGEDSDTRENVLAHFVGWAIVFDLMREGGRIEWNAWLARYGEGIATGEARERLERTLAASTVEAWLEHLADPRPEVRAATAKGLWKLRSEPVLRTLLDALEVEKDPEVRVVFSINALAAAGELPLQPELTSRVWRTVWPKLRRTELADGAENRALGELMRSFRYGARGASQGPLEALRRLWAE